MEEAEKLKNQGNEFFKNGDNVQAIDWYTKSLDLNRSAPVLCNRALAYLRMECTGAALIDAEEAIKLDPTFVKAYYRKASAHLQLGKFKEALRDFKQVVAIVPNDPDALAKYNFCEKEVTREKFLRSIASEDTKPPSERTDLSKLSIPDTYRGPRLPATDELTLDYVMSALDEFRGERLIARRDLVCILLKAITYFRAQPNLVKVEVPDDCKMTVCGDTHGQYYDLLNIFKLNGHPSPNNWYLFNGDFVDRGSYSFETVTALLLFKMLYPNHLFMSRGNHETMGMNKMYGFEGEVKAKYDEAVLQLYQELFQTLPLGHVINGEVFVTHGGLFAKDGVTFDDIQQVSRFREPPDDGIMCEMLWSDPQPMKGRAPSKRGVALSFGPDVTENFLKTNGLKYIVRSHEVRPEGYEFEQDGKCITVFSAPNYCDQVGNKGAYLHIKRGESKPTAISFTHVPHPGKKPMQYSSALGGMLGM